MTYSVQRLLNQTRLLAADYYRTTGKTLPVTSELAKHDAIRLLPLVEPETAVNGVDAIGTTGCWQQQRFQIKGRVTFEQSKSSQRLGQLSTNAEWDYVLLILFNDDYQPYDIYVIDRAMLLNELTAKHNKRGAMTLAKFKIISDLVWSKETGIEQHIIHQGQ